MLKPIPILAYVVSVYLIMGFSFRWIGNHSLENLRGIGMELNIGDWVQVGTGLLMAVATIAIAYFASVSRNIEIERQKTERYFLWEPHIRNIQDLLDIVEDEQGDLVNGRKLLVKLTEDLPILQLRFPIPTHSQIYDLLKRIDKFIDYREINPKLNNRELETISDENLDELHSEIMSWVFDHIQLKDT